MPMAYGLYARSCEGVVKAEMSQSGVTVSDLSFAYGDRHAVFEHAHWQFAPGRMHAVMGPSGSGKTTLFRLISKELLPDSGVVMIDGKDLAGIDGVRLRRSLVARVYQDYRLVPYLDALDNTRLPQEIVNTLAAEPDRAEDLLTRLGLGDHLHDRTENLSGGEQQRVAIARALVTSPRAILADEPTGALDEDSTAEISTLLAEVAHEWGLTVIVATHDEAIAGRADHVVRIHHHVLADD